MSNKDYEFNSTKQPSNINMGYNSDELHRNKVVAIANKLVIWKRKKYISKGFSTDFGIINRRFSLEEIREMLIGKTYVNETYIYVNEKKLIRGFQYRQRRGGYVDLKKLR